MWTEQAEKPLGAPESSGTGLLKRADQEKFGLRRTGPFAATQKPIGRDWSGQDAEGAEDAERRTEEEAGDRRTMMVVMCQLGGPVFFTWDRTRWEALASSVHQNPDRPGMRRHTPISIARWFRRLRHWPLSATARFYRSQQRQPIYTDTTQKQVMLSGGVLMTMA